VPEIVPLPELACGEGTARAAAPAPEPTWACTRPDGTRHGPFVTRFPDGTPALRGAYEDGVLDGAWERFHPSGASAERGTYARGLKTGRWTHARPDGAGLGAYELARGTGIERRWLDDGAPFSEVALKGGVRHGAAKLFTRDGGVLGTARYVNGKLDGAYAVGTRSSLRLEENYANGVRTGARSIWRDGIVIAEERYDRRGKLDGDYTLWRTKTIRRATGRYAHGKRIGAWVWTDQRGHKEREGSYVDGKKDGTWTEWVGGKLAFSGTYRAGKPEGPFTYYDRNGGQLGTFAIAGGSGTMLTFWPNRKPASKQRLVKGQPDGRYEELTPRGKVVVEGRYRAGAKHGTWKEWTGDGVLVLEQTWKRGKLDGIVKKYVDGKLSLEATYQDGQAHGAYVEHRDGKPAVTGQFVADRKHGAWTHHAADGTVVLTATYRDGVLEGPWRQLVDGVVIEGTMVAGRRSGTWTRTDKAGVVRTVTYETP